MQTIDILHGLKKVLSGPDKWTKHVSARDEYGRPTSCRSDKAVCWCLTGALQRVVNPLDHADWERGISILQKGIADKGLPPAMVSVPLYNDLQKTTYEDVASMLDKLIAEESFS